ncbi:hypothetical protein BRD19_11390 [Halobacteriales archaeon SW_7_65_23]|nr:MAG: hypothetical protein BRD19_11390 [Halobacteriales archaeon SW_7_65_23]
MWWTRFGGPLVATFAVVVVLALGVASGGVGAIDQAAPDTPGGTVAPVEPAAGEPPLADAGLDQTVPPETTVYLDGGGSRSPDGELVDYEWEIERPDGTTTTPICLTGECVRATFLPTETGVYAVTLTVTDDDGETAEDTLYVTVTDNAPPSATLTGPDTLEVDESGTFTLQGSAGDAPLSSLRWLVDGDVHDSTFVDGGTEWQTTLSFDAPGTYTVGGRLTDVVGLTAEDYHTVTVESNDDGGDDEGPFFDVAVTATNSPVRPGETVTVEAMVKNIGDAADTQEVTLGAEFADDNVTRTVGSLAPGESQEVTASFDADGVDPGRYNVTVASEDDTDRTQIRVGTAATIEVTEIVPDHPDDPEQPYRFRVEVKNTGTVAAETIVWLTIPGEDERIGGLGTDEIEPGETVAVPTPVTWHHGPHGWHALDGEDVEIRATTTTWNGDYRKDVAIRQLPTYELGMPPSDVTLTPSDENKAVAQVAVLDAEITNTGDLPGDATARFNLLKSENGESTGEKDQTSVSIGPGETYVIDQYPGGMNELFYNPQQEWEDTIKVEVEVEDDRKVHDSATARKSWNRVLPDDPGGPCETGEAQMDVVTSPTATIVGNRVSYDVYLAECEDGEPVKRELSPSEYSVEYDPGSIGPAEYLTLYRGSEKAVGEIPRQTSKDEIRFAWRVEHHGSEAWGVGAAIWVER